MSDIRQELLDAKRTVRNLGARNTKLVELLKASRDRLQTIQNQVEELSLPPSTYGTLIADNGDESAEVFTGNRRMRVRIAPGVTGLVPGHLVRLGEGQMVVEACGPDDAGELVQVTQLLDAHRAVIADATGVEQVVRLAEGLTPKVGDSVVASLRARFASEVVPKAKVSQLSLEEVPDITYADIGGLDDQIGHIRDAVELPFSQPELYASYHLHPPKGVLLYGPPGCGKTLIAKAVANSLAGETAHFLNVKGPELLNKYVGETERQIRFIFERARDLATDGNPVIVFFDEMESIFRTRGSGVSSDMETTVVPQLLTELDGVETLSNVIVIGATNREELIDPAILRPGRLDVKIRVDRPGRDQAAEIFGHYLDTGVPVAAPAPELIEGAVEYLFRPHPCAVVTLADGTEETLHFADFISGAMIANIVDRAKKLAIKDHIAGLTAGITAAHLRSAIDAEGRENEDLPNTNNPEEWNITRLRGRRVTEARLVHDGGVDG